MTSISSISQIPTAIPSFDLVDKVVFDSETYNGVYEAAKLENLSFTYCQVCNVNMNQTPAGLECPECHCTKQIIGDLKDCVVESSGILKTSISGKKSEYTSVPDNSKSQRKQILDQLIRLNDVYTSGPKFPKNILESTANSYNDIQKLVIDTFDDNGEVNGGKKFVKRGSIKDETLGAWLYYTCINSGLSRKKKDIAEFMQLSSNGISRGDTILRNLYNEGKITIPAYVEPSDDFSRRYLEALGLLKMTEYGDMTETSERYKGFVDELVETSIKKRIAACSIKSSKIVGAIWVLIVKENLGIKESLVEDACDKTRKNTFTRFSKAIDENITAFIPVFEKYKINVGFKYKKIVPVEASTSTSTSTST